MTHLHVGAGEEEARGAVAVMRLTSMSEQVKRMRVVRWLSCDSPPRRSR